MHNTASVVNDNILVHLKAKNASIVLISLGAYRSLPHTCQFFANPDGLFRDPVYLARTRLISPWGRTCLHRPGLLLSTWRLCLGLGLPQSRQSDLTRQPEVLKGYSSTRACVGRCPLSRGQARFGDNCSCLQVCSPGNTVSKDSQ